MIRPPGSSERPDLPLAVVMGAGVMGAAIARRLGQDHRLLVADRNGGRLDALQAELRAEGHDARTAVCDVTVAAQVAQLATLADGWRTLVHVAALSPSMGDFETIMSVNLCGALYAEREFGTTASSGSVAIFISSLAAHAPSPHQDVLDLLDNGATPDLLSRITALLPEQNPQDAYRVSKLAMNRMCSRRAASWGKRGARILSLSPGLIATSMGALEFKDSPQKLALYERSPLQREGTVLEIAATVAFLASSGASFITGTDILVDGGIAAALAFPDEQ